MNVNLTPDLEQFVQNKVQAGRYNSASEVVREALRLLEEQDEIKTLRKEEMRKKIAQGLESLRLGKGKDGEDVFARIKNELDALERRGRV